MNGLLVKSQTRNSRARPEIARPIFSMNCAPNKTIKALFFKTSTIDGFSSKLAIPFFSSIDTDIKFCSLHSIPVEYLIILNSLELTD